MCAEASTVLRAVAADFTLTAGVWRSVRITVFGTYQGAYTVMRCRKCLCSILAQETEYPTWRFPWFYSLLDTLIISILRAWSDWLHSSTFPDSWQFLATGSRKNVHVTVQNGACVKWDRTESMYSTSALLQSLNPRFNEFRSFKH
jgi:hypothetical protein